MVVDHGEGATIVEAPSGDVGDPAFTEEVAGLVEAARSLVLEDTPGSEDLGAACDLPAHLAAAEDLPVMPLFLQRRWARISRRFMAEYRKGVGACDAIRAVKNQSGSKRHRCSRFLPCTLLCEGLVF